jgi:hypothetical protein
MATDATFPLPTHEFSVQEPEIVPLADVGKWIAWSSDGMRILGAADTIEEAERLAQKSGEANPILERPPTPHRL